MSHSLFAFLIMPDYEYGDFEGGVVDGHFRLTENNWWSYEGVVYQSGGFKNLHDREYRSPWPSIELFEELPQEKRWAEALDLSRQIALWNINETMSLAASSVGDQEEVLKASNLDEAEKVVRSCLSANASVLPGWAVKKLAAILCQLEERTGPFATWFEIPEFGLGTGTVGYPGNEEVDVLEDENASILFVDIHT
jgi:hypothetical protein